MNKQAMSTPSSQQPSELWKLAPMRALANDRQRAFVLEFFKDHNATQAAIRAGYTAKSAASTASHLLATDHKVARAMADVASCLQADGLLAAEEVLRKDSAIASSNLFDLMERVTSHGVVWKDLSHLPREIQELVQEITVDPEKGTVKLKLHSKHPALERLHRFHRLARQAEKQAGGDVVEADYQVEEPPSDREQLLDFAVDVNDQARQFGIWPDGSVGDLVAKLEELCG